MRMKTWRRKKKTFRNSLFALFKQTHNRFLIAWTASQKSIPFRLFWIWFENSYFLLMSFIPTLQIKSAQSSRSQIVSSSIIRICFTIVCILLLPSVEARNNKVACFPCGCKKGCCSNPRTPSIVGRFVGFRKRHIFNTSISHGSLIMTYWNDSHLIFGNSIV